MPRIMGRMARGAVLGLAVLSRVSTESAHLAEMPKRGVLRVLVVPEAPRPEFFSFDAARPGFDREILEAFAHLKEMQAEFVAVQSWDNLIPALLQGKGDVIAGGFRITEARQKLVAFSSDVFPT